MRPIIPTDSKRFMDRFRVFIRSLYYAFKTEKTYCYLVLAFIRFHNLKHPESMGNVEIEHFLVANRCSYPRNILQRNKEPSEI